MKYIALMLAFMVPAVCGGWTLSWNCDGEGDPEGYLLIMKPSVILKSDLDCDGDVDGTDAFKFKKEFGDMEQIEDTGWCHECLVVCNEDGSYTCEEVTP